VRIGDSAVVRDTFTLESTLLCDHTRIWSLLDDISLHAFATALPPPVASSATSVASHNNAEMSWFATVNVFTLGAFIANRLELALMTRFRQWAEANGSLARIKGAPSSPDAPAPSATFPGAYSAASASTEAAAALAGLRSSSVVSAAALSPRTPSSRGGSAAATPFSRPAALPSPALPVSSGGGLGLMSKNHLAVFWDGLGRSERLKIVMGDKQLGTGSAVSGSSGSSGIALTPAQLLLHASGGKPGTAGSWPDPAVGSRSGGGSSKSVSGGKQSKRRGGAHSGAAQRAAQGWGPSPGGSSDTSSACAAATALSPGGGMSSSAVGQDTLGPLPTFSRSKAASNAALPLPLSAAQPSPSGGGVANTALAASSAGSGSTASDTVTCLTAATQLASNSSGRASQTAGGSFTFETGGDDDAVPATALSTSGFVATAAAATGAAGLGSTGVLRAQSAMSESCATEVDESTAHSVGTAGGAGSEPPSDLFNQDISQLMGMWPFSLIEQSGLSVVQVRAL
jgi:hypothetical protein